MISIFVVVLLFVNSSVLIKKSVSSVNSSTVVNQPLSIKYIISSVCL